MKRFLRSIRRGRWIKHPALAWLDDGELPSDALGDIQTQDCRLSVYAVAGEADIQMVVAALAATKDHIAKVDYAVFKDVSLVSLGITARQTEGDTPNHTVNRMHYELENLTVVRLAQLAETISTVDHKRIQKKQIETLLQRAASNGHLDKGSCMRGPGARRSCKGRQAMAIWTRQGSSPWR